MEKASGGDVRGTERMWVQMFRVFLSNKIAVLSALYCIGVVL